MQNTNYVGYVDAWGEKSLVSVIYIYIYINGFLDMYTYSKYLNLNHTNNK